MPANECGIRAAEGYGYECNNGQACGIFDSAPLRRNAGKTGDRDPRSEIDDTDGG